MPKPKKTNNNLIQPRIFIYCEGSETERNYLAGYISHKYNGYSSVQFVEIPKIKQNTPKSIVTRVVNDIKNDGHLSSDIHWAVYDRESKSKIKEEEHLEALQLAKSNNINVVFSNVCIEQWFLYHFIYSKAAYTSCSNLLKESPLKSKLKEVGIKSYDKAEPEIYDYLKLGVEKARINAKKINKEVIEDATKGIDENQPYKLNPYTNFYELLDEIDLFLLKESFSQDLVSIKKVFLYFSNEGINKFQQEDLLQSNLWNKFKVLYEKYLHPKTKFSAIWRKKASEKLEIEAIFLEADIDGFYYQNIK